MVLNSEELIALNAVIDNVPIYGLQLKDKDLEEKQRVCDVIDSLQKKEIIIEKSFTDKGFVMMKLLEEYKKSKIHIFINKLRVVPIDDDNVIVIELRNDNEFLISRIQKVALEKKFIEASKFLQQSSRKRFIPYANEKMSKKELEEELDDSKWEEVLLIQKHEEKNMFLNKLYFMNDNIGYCYDYISEEKTKKEPRDIRIELMDILEIGGQ